MRVVAAVCVFLCFAPAYLAAYAAGLVRSGVAAGWRDARKLAREDE